MKRLLYISILFSFFLSCDKEPKKPELPEPDVCDCLEEININISFDCGCDEPPTGALIWDYPELEGLSWSEQVAACQIPEEILSSLTTEELTEICLQYPFLYIDLFTSNNYNITFGFNILYQEFNGIMELFNRADAAKVLLKHYNCEIQKLSGLETNSSIFFYLRESINIIEALLGIYSQKSEVTEEDYLYILHSLVIAHEKEMAYHVPNFRYPFITNFFARAHTIIKISPKCIEKFPGRHENGKFHYGYGYLNETDNIINKLSYCLTN